MAPLVGGLLVSVLDWRTAFLFCAIYGAVALMWTWVAFPETLARTQIRHGASRYLGLLKDRSYVAYMLNAALLTVPYVLFLTAAPKLLIGGLGLSPAAFGAYILLLVVSVLAGSAAAARLARRHAIGNVVRGASWMAVVSVAAALALSEVLTVWRVLGPMLAYVAAHAVLFPLALAGGIAAHASKAGTAAGFIGFAQTGIAGVAVLLLGQLDTIGAETVAFLSLIAALAGLASLRLARAPQR